MFGNIGVVLKYKGLSGLSKGWAPTLLGYSLQGLGKFGLYEIFKYKYSEFVGADNAIKYKTLIYCAASASAEFFCGYVIMSLGNRQIKSANGGY